MFIVVPVDILDWVLSGI